MATVADHSGGADAPPADLGGRLRLVGPGLIAAATGVGAGDIVSSLAAGAEFGLALLWTIVLGAAIKFGLAEGVGRWHLATGSTILAGWRSLGRWTLWYFGVYVIVWGFSFGGAAMSSTGLALNALVPAVSVRWWGILSGLIGFGLVLLGRYRFFERLMTVLVGVMFITVVGSAVVVVSEAGSLLSGMTPQLPEDSIVYVLGLLGGVGGSITLAAYGYWLREKGWRTAPWMPMMRLDNAVAYIVTGVFVIAMLIMAAALLVGSSAEIGGEDGIVAFGDLIGERLGDSVRVLFLLGFLSAAMTSLLGVWNGVSLLFADYVRVARDIPDEQADEHVNESSATFRFYVAWLTFPPMALLWLDQPIVLVLVYAALGAIFMPFLAATLLWLLNRTVDDRWRSGWLSNTTLVVSLLLFLALAVNEVANAGG